MTLLVSLEFSNDPGAGLFGADRLLDQFKRLARAALQYPYLGKSIVAAHSLRRSLDHLLENRPASEYRF